MALSITPRLFNRTDIGFGKAAVLEEIQVRSAGSFELGIALTRPMGRQPAVSRWAGIKSRWPPGGVRTENDNER